MHQKDSFHDGKKVEIDEGALRRVIIDTSRG